MAASGKVFDSALDAIGGTPLIALDRLYTGRGGRLFAKMEFVQPGGSVKDRAALKIIERAYERGELSRGRPVVEMTSGNMGAGLAVVCNLMGNPFLAVMSEGNSPERARMMRALGAEVVLVPQVDGTPGKVTGQDIEAAGERARAIARETGGYFVDQFNNPGSVLAHEEGTGPEIWSDLDGAVDAFVAVVGTGATFIGVSRYLKRQDPRIVCVAVEPAGARVLAGEPVTDARHIMQGTSYGSIPPLWDSTLADLFLAVTDAEVEQYRSLLATTESLYVGFSAAGNVRAAVKLLESGRLRDGANVATVLCDTGLKY